jgi:hypothetical protein
MKGRRGRRRRELLDCFKERSGYSQLKDEAVDRTTWRVRFGRNFENIVRKTAKWMNEIPQSHNDRILTFLRCYAESLVISTTSRRTAFTSRSSSPRKTVSGLVDPKDETSENTPQQSAIYQRLDHSREILISRVIHSSSHQFLLFAGIMYRKFYWQYKNVQWYPSSPLGCGQIYTPWKIVNLQLVSPSPQYSSTPAALVTD